MKKIIKPLLQVFSLILVFVSLVLFVSQLLCYQCSSDEARMKLFRNEKNNSFEVVLFGSSAVRAGFIPTKAYENYGIRSFDYCINHMPLLATKYMIKEVMETQSPELIIIDINGITYCDEATTQNKSVALIELMKEGQNKQDAINDLCATASWENDISLIKYHSNIWNLSKCIKYNSYYENFGTNKSVLKGYTTNPAGMLTYDEDEIVDYTSIDECATFNDYENASVTDLLDYCDTIKDTTEILFVRFPRLTIENYNEREIPYINTMKNFIHNRGYNFVDLTDYIDDLGIDVKKEFVDETHLNHFGAEKFTDFFCQYIISNYNISTYSNLSDWDKCVEYANAYYEIIKEGTLNESHKEYYEFDFAHEYNVFGVS